jgi:hypothetical protein
MLGLVWAVEPCQEKYVLLPLPPYDRFFLIGPEYLVIICSVNVVPLCITYLVVFKRSRIGKSCSICTK